MSDILGSSHLGSLVSSLSARLFLPFSHSFSRPSSSPAQCRQKARDNARTPMQVRFSSPAFSPLFSSFLLLHRSRRDPETPFLLPFSPPPSTISFVFDASSGIQPPTQVSLPPLLPGCESTTTNSTTTPSKPGTSKPNRPIPTRASTSGGR